MVLSKQSSQTAIDGDRRLLAALFILPVLSGFVIPVAAASAHPGVVYTLSNAASGNQVLAYNRGPDGALTFKGAYATGRRGSGFKRTFII